MVEPLVSVIMPAYNAETFLMEAVNSILSQTYVNFELVIINDGSIDRTGEIAARIRDPRVRMVHHGKNLGLPGTRNRGLEEAGGEYIAWLDADDLSHRLRLEKQISFMESRPGVGLCGTWVETIGLTPGMQWQYPTSDAAIRSSLLFDDPLATSSVMLRRSVVEDHDLSFDEEFSLAEDYELWERMARVCETANIPEFLTYYRLHGSQTSIVASEKQKQAVWKVHYRQLARLGVEPTAEEERIHTSLALFRFEKDEGFVKGAGAWLSRLHLMNHAGKVYPLDAFDRMLCERWYSVCSAAASLGKGILVLFLKSPISRAKELSNIKRMKLIVKCVIRRQR